MFNILKHPGQRLIIQMLSVLWLETLLQGKLYSPPFATRKTEALSSKWFIQSHQAVTGQA